VRGVEPFGNHVVLRVAPEQYVFLAHLMRGSVRVRPGQRVARGEPLGRVGSSGFSAVTPEPHLALHLQDSPVPRRGEAVPWSFCGYAADGEPRERGLPSGGVTRDGRLVGQRVRHLEH
jgi:murein DD-endopeptidase MepM/ murein hydrolase activator NlpD